MQIVKNIIRKRLSLAIKESVKIENNTLIFESINYSSLLGVFNDNHWNSLFSYDKNKSNESILYVQHIDLDIFNKRLKNIETLNINDFYIKFNNQNTYYKIECFNCQDINNTIKLTTPNIDINNSSYFSLVNSSYALKLENDTLFLYYNFKEWLKEPHKDKSILINNVKSFNTRYIKDNLVIDICLNNNLCESAYTKMVF